MCVARGRRRRENRNGRGQHGADDESLCDEADWRSRYCGEARPRSGPNDAVVKTTAALICTSDAHTLGGAIGERTDLTLGHEAVGVVYKLGNTVKGFREGDRVAVNAITPCFQCENCLRGYASQCTAMLGGWKFANVKDGNLAEYFHVNDARANLAAIPRHLPDEKAVYVTDMMSTGFMAAEHGNIPIGGSVAIFAQGPVGLMATAGARLLAPAWCSPSRPSPAARSWPGTSARTW